MGDNSQPLVSIIVPSYNRSSYLRETIESLLSQTYSNTEIIVVDDGSTDDTPDMARKYGDRIQYFWQQNQGQPAARNVGIKHARGSLFAFLDDDDRWLPTMLERLVPMFQDEENTGVVHCKAMAFDNEGHKWDHPYIGEIVDLHILLRSWFPPLQASLLRRSLVETLVGFDGTVSGVEDWDFFLRASTHCRFLAVPEVLVEIRSHSANMSKNITRMSTVALRVLEKNSHHHGDCPECRQTIRETRSWLQRRIFDAHQVKVKNALREKHYREALSEAFQSLAYIRSYFMHPAAILLRSPLGQSNAE